MYLVSNASHHDLPEAPEDVGADLGELPALRGNVEHLEHGELTGWIQDPSDPSRRVDISVYVGNRRVGEGRADQYRPDLAEAGVGDGRHGFVVPIEPALFDGMRHDLVVLDSASGARLAHFEFRTEPFAHSWIDLVEAGWLRGEIELRDPDGAAGFDIELLIDGEVTDHGAATLVPDTGRYQFSIRLPESVFDDCAHSFSVRLKSLVTIARSHTEILPSILTPWVHMNTGFASRTLAALSRVGAYRYSGLRNRLECLSKSGGSPEELSNILLAHDIVVEGFENRRDFPSLGLPAASRPEVSIVIPVHGKFELTYHCIASLILAGASLEYEVIVVDDCSTDRTADIESCVKNVRVVRNDENLGFLLSATAGADAARGDYIVFLNNDTEVTAGWLDRLRELFDRFPTAGMAGSKLIYPNGRLQEAGGIVWESGRPWNVGHGENAEDPRFNYTRQVDYVSGAALMIRAAVWEEVGGFSRELVPAYYEDTDLAFKVRAAGHGVWYCSASTVIHFEGMSNGRDLDAGFKRFQTVNAPKFRAKWRRAFRGNGQEGVENLQKNMDRCIDFRVLVVDNSTPRPDQDAGGYAVVQEMCLMQELGCKVTFAPNNMAHMGRATHALQEQGVECVHAPFFYSVGDFLAKRGREFDLVYVIRYDVAEEILPCIREYTSAKVVLNNCDLHFLRELRASIAAGGEGGVPTATRDRELAIMREVDGVMSYSEIEHSIIQTHNMGIDNVFACPWVLEEKRSTVPFEDRADIAFLGGFNHIPNREGIIWFVENVMPLLREALPGVTLNVYGSRVAPEIEALSTDDIVVHGYVASLREVFDTCRVFVAPLLSGAGIKGKVLESIAHGVPAVLSPVAAESTGLSHEVSAMIASTPQDWVDHIVELHDDSVRWQAIANASFELATTRYGFQSGLGQMRALFRHLELDPAGDVAPLTAAAGTKTGGG